ncbi:Protein ASPARTIC PROTEASE IN GUARD CELL 1 [Acorus gramineus]|uniref:Protein ASPARTIC PROTEASE IN GUARD CELL 1 n=1 Tax=Acorus gramineus TaxID=55184 RepID=A0AAV9AWK9_ACOGR|nr:Protein ASPARTIC PROTEASE IN GUARD CELL 1 [Acorus gramineus]
MHRLLLLIFCINGFLLSPTHSINPSKSARLKLLRAPVKRAQDLARDDNLRKEMIARSIARRRRSARGGLSFQMPMSSGAYAGTGQYFVRLRLGTPAQKFVLVADTGSDLTWVNCRYRRRRCARCAADRGRRRRVFVADESESFRPISCASRLCRNTLPFSLTTCPSRASPCAYDYGYADGSKAQGFFASESMTITLSNRRNTKLKGLVVGCTSSFVGSSFNEADGVLGLGYSNTSFATESTRQFGGRFAYCLVDHLSPKSISGYLVFGGSNRFKPNIRYAKLVIEPEFEPFYGVEVIGISIGGTVLRIPLSVWDIRGQGGVIIDSGTSLTSFVKPAYLMVMSALTESLKGFKRVRVTPFEFCFNSTGFNDSLVPSLVIHFTGPARFEPPKKSYIIDVADRVKCVGFLSASWPGVSTIGNIIQQNFKWEFDVVNKRLGFQPSSCSSH